VAKPIAVLDVDGTLVDTNYHHAISWYRAERGHRLVLASSGQRDDIEHYLDLLDARGLIEAWTSSADVERTKPDPDLVVTAVDKVGGGEAVLVGDSTFDCEAAARAGVPTVAILTGGFSDQELRHAGAKAVFESLTELCRRLDETPLA
jgi:phosphoglycolate phosphatase-like HAD superfamily hydrolase